MQSISTIGLDIADQAVLRWQLRRRHASAFFQKPWEGYLRLGGSGRSARAAAKTPLRCYQFLTSICATFFVASRRQCAPTKIGVVQQCLVPVIKLACRMD
jgi:hypothetical protein